MDCFFLACPFQVVLVQKRNDCPAQPCFVLEATSGNCADGKEAELAGGSQREEVVKVVPFAGAGRFTLRWLPAEAFAGIDEQNSAVAHANTATL